MILYYHHSSKRETALITLIQEQGLPIYETDLQNDQSDECGSVLLIIRVEKFDDKGLVQKINDFRDSLIEKGLFLALIMISDDNGFVTKWHALRCGVDAFWMPPLETQICLSQIQMFLFFMNQDKELTHKLPEIYIVAIDHNGQIHKHYHDFFTQFGFQISYHKRPYNFISFLETARPSLVLIDGDDLPKDWEMTGRDVVRLIRMQSYYQAVPIILKTSNENKLAPPFYEPADFRLTKWPEYQSLMRVIAKLASRFQAIREGMERDGLTNLLNKSSFRSLFYTDFLRAKRTKTKLSLCMIDLDSFKDLNDEYGHVCGDMVLKALAELLLRRLRRSDVIGRFGGEEFLILLPDANAKQAKKIMDVICVDFSQIAFSINKQGHRLQLSYQMPKDQMQEIAELPPNDFFDDHDSCVFEDEDMNCDSKAKIFHVSFSAGITDNLEYETIDGMIQEADLALYEAKNQGKNQIVIYKQ